MGICMRRRSCDPYSDRAAGPEMTLTLHRQVKQTGRVSRLQARLFSGFRAGVGVTLPARRHGPDAFRYFAHTEVPYWRLAWGGS